MTHEQKPESAESRTRAMEELCAAQDFYDRVVSSSPDEQIAVGQDHHTRLERAVRAVIAEAQGAAKREAQDIEEAKDEGANYALTSLALLFGRDGFEIREGAETWEGDVNATLEGILKAGGLIDEEGDLLDLATLKDRLAEQRREDAKGAEPIAWVPVHPKHGNLWTMTTNDPNRERLPHEYPLAPLYERSANVAALEARVRELEGALVKVSETDNLRAKPDYHRCPVDQLAFELAWMCEEAELSANDLVIVNQEKLKTIARRVLARAAIREGGE